MKRVLSVTVLGLILGAFHTRCATKTAPAAQQLELRADGLIPPPPIIIRLA